MVWWEASSLMMLQISWRSSSSPGRVLCQILEFNFLASNRSSLRFWAHMAGQHFRVLEWNLSELELGRGLGDRCPYIKTEHLLQELGFAGDRWTLRDNVLVERRGKSSPAGDVLPFSSFCCFGGQCDWPFSSHIPIGRQVALPDPLFSLKTTLEAPS